MDFSKVLVTDSLSWELFGAAARERLLFARGSDDQDLPSRGGTACQRALSLLVLFDQIVLHDFGEAFRLPDLEKCGIVEVISAVEPTNVQPLRVSRRKSSSILGGYPSKGMLQSVALIENFRPFIVNRLLAGGNIEFFSALAEGLKVSRRRCLELFFDYALAAVRGDQAACANHIFTAALPGDLLRDITKELFAYSSRGDGMLSPTNYVLLVSTIEANRIAIIRELSAKHGLGVATQHYGECFRSEPALRGAELDAVAAANRFLTVRAAFREEDGFLPRVNNIREALALRKDPHLRALREQLALFHRSLVAGDTDALLEARREIKRARRKLQRRAAWDRALRWVAYLSVPVGVAEILNGTPPLVGTSIAVVGAAGAAGSRKVEKDNEWVLFGT